MICTHLSGNRLAILLVVPVLCASTLLAGCCGEIRSRQEVDLTPLIEAHMPEDFEKLGQVFDRSLFDHSYASLNGMSMGGEIKYVDEESGIISEMTIFLDLAADTHDGEKALEIGCAHFDEPAEIREENNSRYCVSYVVQYRADPAGLCVPEGTYGSFVSVQKDRLLIEIKERTNNKHSRLKENVIQLLADQLNAKADSE